MTKIEKNSNGASANPLNILAYAAAHESAWAKMLAEETGYKRKTTFYADFTIADWYGAKSVRETYESAIKHWLSNLEYATELVMVLNHKCWWWHGQGDETRSALYSELYYEAENKLLNHYEGNEKAIEYIFKTLD